MKLIKFVFFIVAISASSIFSQVVIVKDIQTKKVIQFATIQDINSQKYVITNADGEANLSKFDDNSSLIIQMLGYKKQTKSITDIKESNFVIYLEPTHISLDQIVVSSTKWQNPKKENPIKISSLNAKDIEFNNTQTAADLLSSSGEVFVQKSQQGGGSPMIRGFATNRLLIAVDGIRMNTAIFRSGNLQNVISLDNYALQSLEVLFGPGSVIYGSDAIGGVMSFYTLSPEFSLHENILTKGNAVIRHSSANNEKTVHFDFNLGWTKFSSLTSATFTNYGDLEMGSFGPDEYLRNEFVERINGEDVVFSNTNSQMQVPTGYSQVNLMQKFGYKISENWLLDYGFHHSSTTDYSRFDRLIRYKNGLPRSSEWNYGPQIWQMHNLGISSNSPTLFYNNLAIRFAYQHFEESRHDRDFASDTRSNRYEKVNAYSANFDFVKNFDKNMNFVYGIEFVFNDVISTGTDENIITNEVVAGPSRYPKSNWSSSAVYFAYKNKLSEKWIFESGVRYNFYQLKANFDTTFYAFPFTDVKLNEGAFSGNIGLIYNVDDSWTIGTNLSSGFRSPNVDDIGKVFDSEPGSVVVPNPNLKAEYSYNVDLGIAKVFDDFAKIDFTAFYTILNNAMVRRNFTLNGQDSIMYDGELSQVQAIQNAAKANVWGIQTGVELKFPFGIGFSAKYNFQKGEEELDNGNNSPLRHAAPQFATAHLTYSSQNMKADFYAIANGEISYKNLPESEKSKKYLYAKDENGNPYSPSWYTINLKLSYFISDNFTFIGGIENITDQRYRPYSSGLAAAGRNFIVALKMGI